MEALRVAIEGKGKPSATVRAPEVFSALAAAAELGYRPAPGTLEVLLQHAGHTLEECGAADVANAAAALPKVSGPEAPPLDSRWLGSLANAALVISHELDAHALAGVAHALSRSRVKPRAPRPDDGRGGGGGGGDGGGTEAGGGYFGGGHAATPPPPPAPTGPVPYVPSERWLERYYRAMAPRLGDLSGPDAARLLYALRRFGAPPPPQWLDSLAAAAGRRSVLGAMSGPQLVAAAAGLAALAPGAARPDASPPLRTLVRELGFAAAAAADLKPSDAAALLGSLAALGHRSGEAADALLAAAEPGLPALPPRALVGISASLRRMGHLADDFWAAAYFQALTSAVGAAQAGDAAALRAAANRVGGAGDAPRAAAAAKAAAEVAALVAAADDLEALALERGAPLGGDAVGALAALLAAAGVKQKSTA
jgi:hypothetical protein